MQSQNHIGQAITTQESYNYAPLESPQHIRLIQFRPQNHDFKAGDGKLDSRPENETALPWISRTPSHATRTTKDFHKELITASIVHVPLSSITGAFHTMSYRWDSTINSPYTATFSGQTIRISPTVHAMLRHCSATREIQYIWIDALCINQADDKEKSVQVAMMFDIYSMAKEVIVWLGVENNPSSVCSFQGNNEDEDEAESQAIVSQLAELSASFQFTDNQAPDQDISRLKSLNHASQSFRFIPLIKMLSHPWFERVWVIQEVVVAERVKIMYRGLVFDGDTFFNLMMRTALDLSLVLVDRAVKPEREPRGPMTSLFVRMSRAAHKDVVRAAKLGKEKGEGKMGGEVEPSPSPPDWFGALLGSSTLFISTDPRDQVYGLYGLCNPTQKPYLPPIDYTLSTRDVYIKTAQALLLESADVYILIYAGLSKQSGDGPRIAKGNPQLDGRLVGLPSWVPNWTFDPPVHTLGGIRPYVQVYDCVPGTGLIVSKGEDPGCISVRGRIIDVVNQRASRFVAKPPTFAGTEEEERELNLKNLTVFDEILGLAKSGSPYRFFPTAAFSPVIPSRTPSSISATSSDVIASDSKSEDDNSDSSGNAGSPLTPEELTWRTLVADQYAFRSPAPAFLASGFSTWYASTRKNASCAGESESETKHPPSPRSASPELQTAYHTQWQKLCAFTRRVFTSQKLGLMGLGPGEVEVGDVIATVYGAPVPFILRRVRGEEGDGEEAPKRYLLVGECFVYGLMHGAAVELGLGEESDIILV